MAALRLADDISSASDLKVMEGKYRAAAQIGMRLQCEQATFGIVAQAIFVCDHEVAVPLPAPTSHTAAKLVQVGDPKTVSTVYDHRIGMGHVDTRLDDGGREQDIIFAVLELEHLIFGLLGGDLRVQYGDAEFGEDLKQRFSLLFDPGNGVEDVEDLPATAKLPEDRLLDHLLIVTLDEGTHPLTLGRRRKDLGEALDLAERHIERARDRGGGHAQQMHIDTHLFERLLLLHTELMLLVDHHQRKVFELRFKQRMGTYHHIDTAVRQTCKHVTFLFGSGEAVELGDRDPLIIETLFEAFVVLGTQQCRGCDHHRLIAVLDSYKHTVHRYFGLPKAHIGTQKPVHHPAALHIVQHLEDGTLLILRMDKARFGHEDRMLFGDFQDDPFFEVTLGREVDDL